MSGTQKTILLGCDPVVRLVITEDEGNLVFQLFSQDPTTDIDGFFFNLTDDSVTPTITIFPKVDDPIGDVIDFRAEPGILNQLDNGAQTQEQFDVEVQFGENPGSNAGQVNETGFTLYLDSLQPLTLDDVEMSKLVAVVNSDNGQGLALIGGETAAIEVTETVIDVDFGISDGADIETETGIASADGWFAQGGAARASGAGDGALRLDPVTVAGAAALSFDIRAINPQNFEASGSYADSFSVEVQLDDGSWIVLDTFVVDPHTDTFTGSETGQSFGGGDATTLTYSGGVLDGIDGTASFRLVADISAANEILEVDNIQVTTTSLSSGPLTTQVPVVIQSEDFDGLSYASQSDAVEGSTHWDVRHGQLETDGGDDGAITFAELAVDGPVEFAFDARGINIHEFEADGRYADSLRVEVQIDGGDWVVLDEFRVNDAGNALVGSETGQAITGSMSGLEYAGGILDDATESVQFRFVSDISACNEKIRIDNVEVREIETVVVEGGQEVCEDFETASAGDVVDGQFDFFTVSAQRNGDDANSENDAMIFDTANPTGGDWDLHFPDQGNAIIVSEDNDSDDPDDEAHGGTITFNFDAPSVVTSLTVLDIEEPGGMIDLYDAEGELISSIDIPITGNNGTAEVAIGVEGVAVMDVVLAGSGAVDDLCFIPPAQTDAYCDQYAVAYDDWTGPNDTDDAYTQTETDQQEPDPLADAIV
ncbi:hypothetical protein KUH32_15425 [Thalassococcus sp. CAU 1522]|uniref:Uncharacterized protein n=1 Tax=Thalassococcus arenae TaxID=2851652 RepID=A0ABS6NAV5_9RHOB|nr:hypothetical protein [Thalassococcus arenae]MBV2361154.1 hypothetical protein [Thalassococcus arenae]